MKSIFDHPKLSKGQTDLGVLEELMEDDHNERTLATLERLDAESPPEPAPRRSPPEDSDVAPLGIDVSDPDRIREGDGRVAVFHSAHGDARDVLSPDQLAILGTLSRSDWSRLCRHWIDGKAQRPEEVQAAFSAIAGIMDAAPQTDEPQTVFMSLAGEEKDRFLNAARAALLTGSSVQLPASPTVSLKPPLGITADHVVFEIQVRSWVPAFFVLSDASGDEAILPVDARYRVMSVHDLVPFRCGGLVKYAACVGLEQRPPSENFAPPGDNPVSFDDLDPDGRWITVNGQHVHIDKEGKVDAGSPAIRELLEKEGHEHKLPDGVRNDTSFPALDGLKMKAKLGGSTGAKLMTDADGKDYVVKRGANEGHLREEDAADRIYRAVGLPVPDSKVFETATGPVKVSKFLDGAKPLGKVLQTADPQAKQSLISQAQKGFVADALTGNWDVVGMEYDNMMVTKDGTVVRIDNGGSLRYRAQGEKKNPSAWTGSVTEIESMRHGKGSRSAQAIMGSVTEEEIRKQVKDILPKRDAILKAAPEDLRATLSERLDDLEKRFGSKEDAHSKLVGMGVEVTLGYRGGHGEPLNVPNDDEVKAYTEAYSDALTRFNAYGIPFGTELNNPLTEETGKFGTGLRIYSDPTSQFAGHNQGAKRINMNAANDAKMESTIFSAARKDMAAGRIPGFCQVSRTDAMVHELAHQLRNRMTKNQWQAWEKAIQDNGQSVDHLPSFYAQENSDEAWAEAVTAVVTDKKHFQGHIRELAEDILSRMKPAAFADWDEDKHPRGEKGRWASQDGDGSGSTKAKPAWDLEPKDIESLSYDELQEVDKAIGKEYARLYWMKKSELTGEEKARLEKLNYDGPLNTAIGEANKKHEAETAARQADASKSIKAGRPWEATRETFIGHHVTGNIPESAYRRTTAPGGMDYIKKDRFKELAETVNAGGKKIEIRIEREPAQYVATDKDGDIIRGKDGLTQYMTDEEVKAAGLSPHSITVGAFDGDKPVGHSSDELGATGVYVTDEYQKAGLGIKLLNTFMRETGRLQSGSKVGQATGAGRNLVGAWHKKLVTDAVESGKKVPDHVLADYPELQKKAKFSWEEDKHPRGEKGRFTDGDGTSTATAGKPRVVTDIKEMIEIQADLFEKDHGWSEEHTKKGFVKNWKKSLKELAPDPEAVPEIQKAIDGAYQKYNLPAAPIFIRKGRPEESHENAHWDSGFMVITDKVLDEKKYHSRQKSLNESKMTVKEAYPDLIEGLIVHEFGHAYHGGTGKERDNEMIGRAIGVLSEKRKEIRKLISDYAADTQFELIAECYAMRKHPDYDSLPDETKRLVTEVLGKDRKAGFSWDEDKHPRGEHGRWASGDGADEISHPAIQDRQYESTDERRLDPDDPMLPVISQRSSEWTGGLKQEQKEAIHFYSKNEGYEKFKKMRTCPEGLDCLDEKLLEKAAQIQDAILSAPKLDTPITSWRHLDITSKAKAEAIFAGFLNAKKHDKEVALPGFNSASLDPGAFASTSRFCLEIRSKRCSHIGDVSEFPEEMEVLHPHNARYKVVDIQDDVTYTNASRPGTTSFSFKKNTVVLEEVGDPPRIGGKAKFDWEEDKHPRGEKGRFATVDATSSSGVADKPIDKKASKGAPWTMSPDELSRLDTDELDKMAYGFTSGDVIRVHPNELKVQYQEDLIAAEYEMEKAGSGPKQVEWAKKVDLSEPIQIKIKNGEKVIEDGHHRYVAAKKLGKTLKAEVTIEDNPIKAIYQKAVAQGLKVPEAAIKDFGLEQLKIKTEKEWNPKLRPRTDEEIAAVQKVHTEAKEWLGSYADKAEHISPEQRKQYKEAMHQVTDFMTVPMIEHVRKNLDNVHFHKSIRELTAKHAVISGEGYNPRSMVGGFFIFAHLEDVVASDAKPIETESGTLYPGAKNQSKGSGQLYLDGGSEDNEQYPQTTKEIYAHEMSHAIDGPYRFSKTKEWDEAWRDEIMKVDYPLSKYATKNQQEGFAEFGRLVLGGRVREARESFPKCWTAWKKFGLIG